MKKESEEIDKNIRIAKRNINIIIVCIIIQVIALLVNIVLP